MKKLILLSLLVMPFNVVSAENLFQNNNPFPQTVPQSMNNIYESEPAKIQEEAKQQRKFWFRKGRNLQEQDRKNPSLQTYPANEEEQDKGRFYIFK